LEPHPTDVIQIRADGSRVVRTTATAPPGEPAPAGWAPFALPGDEEDEPGRISWMCLSAECDVDAVMAERGFVRELAWTPKTGHPTRFYRRGDEGGWLESPAGGIAFRGRLLPWVARPRGAFVAVEPVLTEPLGRTRFAAAQPLDAIAPLLPLGAKVVASGQAWAVIDAPVADQLWWIDRYGQLSVQRLPRLDAIGVPLFAKPWAGSPGVISSGRVNEAPCVELVGEQDQIRSSLDAWLRTMGWRGAAKPYGPLSYIRKRRNVQLAFDFCQLAQGLPSDLPHTSILVVEERP
jgi:hypothetical protein